MNGSFRHHDLYRDHEIEIITWVWSGGKADCTFTVKPANDEGFLTLNSGLHSQKSDSEEEAKKDCLAEIHKIIDKEYQKRKKPSTA